MAYEGPFIDFHTHLFPDQLHRAILGWFDTKTDWRWEFRKPWTDAVKFLEGMENLKRYVSFGYAHKPGMARELNRFYADLGTFSPKAVGLMAAHQDDEDLAGLADEGFSMGLKGVKIHCQVQKVSPSDPRFNPLYERVIAHGGMVMLHAGNGPFAGPFVGFDHTLALLDRFPEMIVVVAHLGAFESDRFLREAIQRDNLYLDTSYTFIDNPTNRMDASPELVSEAWEKVLFASDFPGICHSYAAAVEATASIGLPEDKMRAVFHDNASKLLKRIGAI